MSERWEPSQAGDYHSLVEFSLGWKPPYMLRSEIIDLVRKVCGNLDPALICAIIEQESEFDTWAIRYEPAFYDKYIAHLPGLSATEMHGRAISWGLAQVMGETAREVGYKGPFAQLCSPETGIAVGCEVFNRKMAAACGNVAQALLYWNGGEAKGYANEVMARMSKFA
jgi:soluble lytic murein transglycosylase-like protein